MFRTDFKQNIKHYFSTHIYHFPFILIFLCVTSVAKQEFLDPHIY